MAVYKYSIKKRNPYENMDRETRKYTWYMYDGKFKKIDGKYQGYKKRGFQTKEEAEYAEQEFLKSKQLNSSKDIVLNDLWKSYEEYSSIRKQRTSCYDDRIKYNKHIRPMFGDKAIRDISPQNIIQWQREMMAKLSHTTVVNTHKIFSKLLNYGDRIFDTEWNPLNKVGYPKKLEKNQKTDIWTEEEFRQFYNAIDTLEYKVLFMIMFFCGLRRGELLALRWNDLNGNILEIDESIANDMGKQVIKRPKNFNAERFVELDNRITEMLNQLYSEKSQQVGFNEYNFIFGVKGDEPMGFETFRKAKVRYEERAGVKHIRIHDLRHSHVSLLMSYKIPIVAVAERIGDTVEEVLKTYSHALPKSNKEINRLINKLTKNYK